VHGRLRQRLLPFDQRDGVQRHGALEGPQEGAFFANPCFTQIHPTCIRRRRLQSKLTLMSESLRNDGRIWVPKKKEDCGNRPTRYPRRTGITTSSGSTELRKPRPPGHLFPRGEGAVRRGRGVGPEDAASTSTSATHQTLRGKRDPRAYGNLFEMYERITDENGYKVPMRIYPAPTTPWEGSGSTTT